jgi:hypothetical protein
MHCKICSGEQAKEERAKEEAAKSSKPVSILKSVKFKPKEVTYDTFKVTEATFEKEVKHESTPRPAVSTVPKLPEPEPEVKEMEIQVTSPDSKMDTDDDGLYSPPVSASVGVDLAELYMSKELSKAATKPASAKPVTVTADTSSVSYSPAASSASFSPASDVKPSVPSPVPSPNKLSDTDGAGYQPDSPKPSGMLASVQYNPQQHRQKSATYGGHSRSYRASPSGSPAGELAPKPKPQSKAGFSSKVPIWSGSLFMQDFATFAIQAAVVSGAAGNLGKVGTSIW